MKRQRYVCPAPCFTLWETEICTSTKKQWCWMVLLLHPFHRLLKA
jgi:hypothetical protein